MKKTCLLLVLILLLTGCGGKENTSGDLDNNKNNGMQVDLPKKPEKKRNPRAMYLNTTTL